MAKDDWRTDYQLARERLRLVNEEEAEREAIKYDGEPSPDEPATGTPLVVSAAEFFAERDEILTSLWGDGLLVPGGAYTIIGGQGGVGKTIIVVGLLLSLAAGRSEFLGLKLPGEPVPVLVLEAEGSRPRFRERVRGIVNSYGLDPTRLPIFFHARDAVLSIERLGEMVKAAGARAVLADPIGRFHEGDENSSKDWRGAVTNPLAELSRRYLAAPLLCDHYVKPNELRQARHKLRGSAAKVDDCGAAMRLEYGKAGKASRVLFFDRVRDGALPDPDRLALLMDVARGTVEIDPEGSAEPMPESAADDRLERKKQHESEEAQEDIELTLKRLEAEAGWNSDDGISERRLASEAGRSRTGRPFKMALAGLQAQKAIEPTPGGGWKRARRGSEP